MSNRKRTRNTEQLPERFAWLLCADCNSEVIEVVRGRPPEVALTIELEHSETCPDWQQDGRELLIAFLPPEEPDQ